MAKSNKSSTEELKKYCCENTSFSAREDYKRIRTNIQFSLPDAEGCCVIGITSAQPSDGKSLTCVNIAYSFAQIPGKRVLLIDGDMRRPSINAKLGFPQSPGFSNLLAGVTDDHGSIKNVYTPGDGSQPFDVITSGRIPPNPAELLVSKRAKDIFAKLREYYDFIIIDLPPVVVVTDAQIVSSVTDGMIIVVRESVCTCPVLDECLKQLQLANAHILGFVVNGSVQAMSRGYRYKKYSRSAYSYGKGYGYGYGSSSYYGGYYSQHPESERNKSK